MKSINVSKSPCVRVLWIVVTGMAVSGGITATTVGYRNFRKHKDWQEWIKHVGFGYFIGFYAFPYIISKSIVETVEMFSNKYRE